MQVSNNVAQSSSTEGGKMHGNVAMGEETPSVMHIPFQATTHFWKSLSPFSVGVRPGDVMYQNVLITVSAITSS